MGSEPEEEAKVEIEGTPGVETADRTVGAAGVAGAAGPRLVVGVDGSEGSVVALRWAAARTATFGPVQPVGTWHYPWWALTPLAPGAASLPPPSEDFHAEVREAIDAVLDRVGPLDHLEPVTVHGQPGPALVEAALGASMLVVGSRGHGAVAASVLGSVSLYCVNHAQVPVAVIPADAIANDRFGLVVVGMDGSPHARAALDWVVDHAPAASAIEVVVCGRPDDVYEVGLAGGTVTSRWSGPELIDAVVGAARSRRPDRGELIRGSCQDGDPRDVLRYLSADADLLVVGARGHEGVAHLVLGSVTTALVHHPLVPLVVVH